MLALVAAADVLALGPAAKVLAFAAEFVLQDAASLEVVAPDAVAGVVLVVLGVVLGVVLVALEVLVALVVAGAGAGSAGGGWVGACAVAVNMPGVVAVATTCRLPLA